MAKAKKREELPREELPKVTLPADAQESLDIYVSGLHEHVEAARKAGKKVPASLADLADHPDDYPALDDDPIVGYMLGWIGCAAEILEVPVALVIAAARPLDEPKAKAKPGGR